MTASSSSSDSDSDTEEVQLDEVEGESSANEADEACATKARGMAGQYVWPCPREYPSSLEKRKSSKLLLPEDLSREEAGKLFKSVFAAHGHLPALSRLHVFDEPHQKYNKATGVRARHKHFVFKCSGTFAHKRMAETLCAKGVHGHFSFNLCGYQAYLKYCLEPSASKIGADLDATPWSWPAHITVEQLRETCKVSRPFW